MVRRIAMVVAWVLIVTAMARLALPVFARLEVRFLVRQLLEQGHATVFSRRLNLPEPMLQIRHVNTLFDGGDQFRLLDGIEIWAYGTWRSG